MLTNLLHERTSAEDCNAGVIFDNLMGEYWLDEKTIIEAICDAFPCQNVHLIGLSLPTPNLDGTESQKEESEKEEEEAPKVLEDTTNLDNTISPEDGVKSSKGKL